jgi:hypothetical protein
MRTEQIAGPLKSHGVWTRQEWLPSIIASSKYLGILPETLGTLETVDWIPVDLLASIMAELVKTTTQKNETLTMVYNLVILYPRLGPLLPHMSRKSPESRDW